MGVVLLHYNNPYFGGGFLSVRAGSVNEAVLVYFETVSVCAVDLFVLISGYFLGTSDRRDLRKPLGLIAQLFVFGTLFFVIKELPKAEPVTFDRVLSYYVPGYWFVFVYIALYLISPYINTLMDDLTGEGKKRLVVILFALFAVYPILVDSLQYLSGRSLGGISTVGIEGSQSGYTIVNFVLMYVTGRYIRDNDKCYKTSRLLLFLMVDQIMIIAWVIGDKIITGKNIFETTAWNYENPLVIFEAVLFFLIFKNMKIKSSRVINTLSAASFSVYILHIHFLEYLRIEKFADSSPLMLILHMIISAALIYLLSFCLYMVYHFTAGHLFRKLH